MAVKMEVAPSDLDSWTLEAAPSIPSSALVNPLAMLRALCRQESSYGANPVPRHEAIWCPNEHDKQWRDMHKVATARHRDWGCLACCSYGVMQPFYHTLVDHGILLDPTPLLDQRIAFDKAVALLIKKILKQRPQSIFGIGDMWNSGSCNDLIHPTNYMNSLEHHYNEELKRL